MGRQNVIDGDKARRGQRRKSGQKSVRRRREGGSGEGGREGVGRENVMVHVTLAQPLQAVT